MSGVVGLKQPTFIAQPFIFPLSVTRPKIAKTVSDTR